MSLVGALLLALAGFLLALAPAAHAAFGVDGFDWQLAAAPGGPYTQAGGHPFDLSTELNFNSRNDPIQGTTWPEEAIKDVLVDTPPGLVGNPGVLEHCSVDGLAGAGGAGGAAICPGSSQVGVARITFQVCSGNACEAFTWPLPIPVYSLTQPSDAPARFGFNFDGTITTLTAEVRSGRDYGISIAVRNIPEALPLLATNVTFWGVPGDPVHDSQRFCERQSPGCSLGSRPQAFLTAPARCTVPGEGLSMTATIDSWFHPDVQQSATTQSHLPPGLLDDPSPPNPSAPSYPGLPSSLWGAPIGMTGCDQVPFNPKFDLRPAQVSSPGASGYDVDLTMPQEALTDPTAIAQSDLRKVVVTLPQGVRVNPSSADGLQGCAQDQFGLSNGAEPTCPDASKLGTMEIDSPLLDVPLMGSVYLARPFDNPFGSLLGMYLVASARGVVIKVAGEVHSDPSTGQLTGTFDNNPQLPFTRVHLVLNGGPRAALSNPSRCGTYTTKAVMSSWSGKTVESDSSFTTSADGHGAPCGPAGFSPSFIAGTTTSQGGAFSPFTVTIARSDADQELSGIQVKTPPGLLARLSSVVPCGEPQAAQGTCPASSQIGHTTVSAGTGPNPVSLPVAGRGPNPVYLTTGYKDAPFGLSVVVPAIAGPFDLGRVVVRARIDVDPQTAQATITSDPLPRILQGIPLQTRTVNVTVDRPGFMFNPTNCDPLVLSGAITSTEGSTTAVSSPFQAVNCATLAFKPSFTVSTAGKTSKANGASLRVHVATHEGPSNPGTPGESNIAKVDVQLPVVLPARLPTLQKACTAAQFASDPAGCPVGSFVGTATAHTPILASTLSGPAILVSHGGQAFPDLVLVLQGEGVRINLTGHTQIKKGITYNHFETVPDAPVSSFDLTLPAGPHGVLTTDVPGRNLCAATRTVTVTKRVTRRVHGHTRKVTVKAKKAVAAPLSMPTTITAQDGAVIHQNTKIAVTGCAAVKSKAKVRKAKGHKR
jgi:hypothetical protein